MSAQDMTKTTSATTERVKASLKKRYAAEKRFKAYGIVAIAASIGFLFLLLISIVSKGLPAFKQTYVKLDVSLTSSALGISDSADRQELRKANYSGVVKQAMRDRFPDVTKRGDKKALYQLVSTGAQYELYDRVSEDPSLIGTDLSLWVLADDELSAIIKSKENLEAPDSIVTRMSDKQIGWAKELKDAGELDVRFNTTFFENGDSREPELAGIRAALMGSAFTLLITFALSFPVAVAAAIYLEEFAPQNRLTDIVEVNINNLAAVPSIVFGFLALRLDSQFQGRS